MSFQILATVAFILALVPCGLFLVNLFAYRRPEAVNASLSSSVSVLIPARNEENNISQTIKSALASRGVEFEVVVLDDHSVDSTLEIASRLAREDSRLRVESSPPLPAGWCGKQHACHVLARLARNPVLVFIDADVRLQPGALALMAGSLEEMGADLVSGIPRQELGTFSEKLLLPLIHFMLLGFLPMHWARRSRSAAFAAGCGQLMVARANAYRRSGGHAAVCTSLHDGLKLPRAFRRAGFRTALLDATKLATCRMYRTNKEVWLGLAKNATEGLGAPATIGPMTAFLAGSQVLPWILLVVSVCARSGGWLLPLVACLLTLLPRVIASIRFKHPLFLIFLHPLSILALLAIQWIAFLRLQFGRPSVWKGRVYAAAAAGEREGLIGDPTNV